MQSEIFCYVRLSDYLKISLSLGLGDTPRDQINDRRSSASQVLTSQMCMTIQEKHTLQQVAQMARVVKRITTIKQTSEPVHQSSSLG